MLHGILFRLRSGFVRAFVGRWPRYLKMLSPRFRSWIDCHLFENRMARNSRTVPLVVAEQFTNLVDDVPENPHFIGKSVDSIDQFFVRQGR